MGKKTG